MLAILSSESSFQTFPDNDAASIKPMITSGLLDEKNPWLREQNEAGAGIFFAVNGMMRGKRGRDYVTEVRAYYADIDLGNNNSSLKRAKALDLLSLDAIPSAIVESKNGLHAYWFATEGHPLDPEEYKRVNLGIIKRVGGDENAKDIARVLRVPGFLHKKNPSDPFSVSVWFHEPDIQYSRNELLLAFPLPQERRRTVIIPMANNTEWGEWGEVIELLSSWQGIPGRRHDALLISAGNAYRLNIPQSRAAADLIPIVESWGRTHQQASNEVRGALTYSFTSGEPFGMGALKTLIGVT